MKHKITKRLALLPLFFIITLIFASALSPTVEAQENTTPPPLYKTGTFPRAMEFDGERVWVANWLDNTITILDALDGSLVRTLEGRGVVAQRPVALRWDGTHMWIAYWQDNLVYRVNAAGQLEHVLGYTEGIQQPVALLFDGAHIWIVNQGRGQNAGSVTKVVTRNLRLFGSYPVGRFPTAITWDGDKIWVANGVDDTVTVLDATSGRFLRNIQVKDTPITLAYDGVNVWVGHYDGNILVFNSDTYEQVFGFEERPGRPVEIYYAFERMWVANSDAGSITDIRAKTGVEVTTFESFGEFSASIVATTNQIWIANWLNNTIHPINVFDALEDTINPPSTLVVSPQAWLPTLAPTPTIPTFTPTPIPPCDTPFDNVLTTGDRGRVEDVVNKIPLRLRADPGRTGEEIRSVAVGTAFTVTGPAVCITDETVGDEWWIPVQIDDTDEEGWFVEALKDDADSGGHYTVEKLTEQ